MELKVSFAMQPTDGVYHLRASRAMGRAIAALPPEELRLLLENPGQLIEANAHRPVKLSHTSVMVEAELSIGGQPTAVAYKRLRLRQGWKTLAGLFRTSKAERAWHLGRALVERGIPTAAPLATCESRDLLGRHESYLATRWIEGSINLRLYLEDLAARPENERRRRVRQAADAVGRLIGQMHTAGVAHRDLKALNLVVVEQPDRLAVYLVDPDGVRLCRRVAFSARAQNLARLAAGADAIDWLTCGDRRRFLEAYLRACGLDQGQWKPLWRAIAFYSARIKRRLKRQGRPLA